MAQLELDNSPQLQEPRPAARVARAMARASKDRIVRALLERHGRTYAEELGIDLARNTPSILFRWLCASILLSARISAETA